MYTYAEKNINAGNNIAETRAGPQLLESGRKTKPEDGHGIVALHMQDVFHPRASLNPVSDNILGFKNILSLQRDPYGFHQLVSGAIWLLILGVGGQNGKGCHTASSLKQSKALVGGPRCLGLGSGPRCQDTILGDVDAQTRFETTSKNSYDPPLSRGYTLGSGENNMKLLELMEMCTKLSNMLHKNRKSDLVSQKK
ncbi:hypothetical protein Tco_1016677 [Tanacetum coccineum]|uniref:Uncharacterized protein n=1 Tax=Tanacetum coccineum TaxID=301880 RepID=A0ABQ5FRW4_9ASTR